MDDLTGDDTNNLVKAVVNLGEGITFRIKYDADGNPSGKSLQSVLGFVNGATSGANYTGNFSYSYESSGSYVSTGNVSVSSGTIASYRVVVSILAPDRVTTKTYTYTFRTVILDGTSPSYYVTLADAITAAS